jgi:phosphoribosylformimino-5-aminoimidazole carboxamide ribotide isomerase
VSAVDFVKALGALPLAGIVYTDIDRDGMLQGLNVQATVALSVEAGMDVIASGGLHTTEDLAALQAAVSAQSGARVVGAITGRAIYEGTLQFAEGQAFLDRSIAPESRR